MANLEVIALDTVTPQLKAPQAGDGYAMPRPVTVTEVVGSTALTLTGATQTTAVPVLNATQTWNNAAITFTGVKFNATDTASNAASLLLDLQVGGSSKFSARKDGSLIVSPGASFRPNVGSADGEIFVSSWSNGNMISVSDLGTVFQNNIAFCSGSAARLNRDAFFSRKAAASLQFGVADAAAPVAQTIGPQSVVAGTSNTAGPDFTIRGSQGTGTGNGGSILFQLAPAGSSGTAQNALSTKLTIATDGRITFTNNISIPGTSVFGFSSRGNFGTSADGVFYLSNNLNNDFGRLQFGGTTSSFPSIKRSTTIIQVRLADDSAYAPMEASTVRTATAYTVATLPAAGTAGRKAYVTDATAPTFLGALIGGGAVVCPVFDNGTAWVAG